MILNRRIKGLLHGGNIWYFGEGMLGPLFAVFTERIEGVVFSMNHPDQNIMRQAIKLAQEKYKEGGHAVAAIIVKEGKIIAKAFTTIKRDNDPT